jgi:hypothetical protein
MSLVQKSTKLLASFCHSFNMIEREGERELREEREGDIKSRFSKCGDTEWTGMRRECIAACLPPACIAAFHTTPHWYENRSRVHLTISATRKIVH